MMRATICIAILIGCSSNTRTDRSAELAACQLISESGGALAKCLVMKYSWGADSTRTAMYAWQGHLDSLRRDHEAQVAALIAQQDSARDRAERARLEQLAQRAAPWASCMRNEQRREGTNWSYKACAQPLPRRAELNAYIAVHRLDNVEGFDLIRAHLANGGDRP